MAMNYKVVEIGGSYCVEEKATGYIIEAYNTQEEAKKKMKFLNLGGSFDGFTPSFVLSEKTKKLNKTSKNM
jgi:hypothetical protein